MITYYIINLFLFSNLILLPAALHNPLDLILLITLIAILVFLKNRKTTIINAIGFFLMWFPYKRNEIICKIIWQIIKTYRQAKTFINTPWKYPLVQFSGLFFTFQRKPIELYLTTREECTVVANYVVNTEEKNSIHNTTEAAGIATTSQYPTKTTPLWALDSEILNTVKYLNNNIETFMFHPDVLQQIPMTDKQVEQMALIQEVEGNLNSLTKTQIKDFTLAFPELQIENIARITQIWARIEKKAVESDDKFYSTFLTHVMPKIYDYADNLLGSDEMQQMALDNIHTQVNLVFKQYLIHTMGFNHNQLAINPSLWQGARELAQWRWWWPGEKSLDRDLVREQLPLPRVKARSSVPMSFNEIHDKHNTLLGEVEAKYGPYINTENNIVDIEGPYDHTEIEMIMCGFPKFSLFQLFFKTVF